jgi:hypothetical protein
MFNLSAINASRWRYFMNKMARFLTLGVLALSPIASFAADAAQSVAVLGKMLYDVEGKRVAAIYRITDDGTSQVIVSGKLINVPSATLSVVDDKLTTSLTKKTLLAAR